MVACDQLMIVGSVTTYKSSKHGRRLFCGDCGTGLFYVNEKILPGMIDVQTGTIDNPGLLPVQMHVQTAEQIPWMETAHDLPRLKRYHV